MHNRQYSRVGKSRPRKYMEYTEHHVPPKNPDKEPKRILHKRRVHHEAYHTLFAAAKSYEDACMILLLDWWTDTKGNFIK